MNKKTKNSDLHLQGVVDMKSNAVGATDMRMNRKKALETLNTAKMLEDVQKKAKGFIWVSKGKTSILVDPAKIQKYLDDDFKISKRYEKK